MDLSRTAQIVVIMLSPTLTIGAAIYAPRVFRAARRLVVARDDTAVRPDHRPIELVADDLRRLLRQHETVKQSAGLARRAQHLVALEAAITDCASEAARALGLSVPDRPAHEGLSTSRLRQLLLDLADAGIVLPPAVGLIAADRRL